MTEIKQPSVPLPSELSGASVAQPAGNPLAQYFRHTKLTIELPSQGKFWPPGTLELNESGEVEVMPLTARDEILLKSPEGLLSGSSVVDSIRSCVPAIKNPWLMPAIDVDTVFIAIRMASFDHELEVSSNCTHCGHINDNVLDLRVLLDSIPKGNIKNIKTVNDLTFEYAPYTYEFVNLQNKMKFDQERLARGLNEAETPDEAVNSAYLQNLFRELAAHNTEAIVVAIKKIIMPDGTIVMNKEQITEFVNNADRDTIKQIRSGIIDMNSSAAMPPITVQCEECEKEYETVVEFNQTNFFD